LIKNTKIITIQFSKQQQGITKTKALGIRLEQGKNSNLIIKK
jgi:hypothetical protein